MAHTLYKPCAPLWSALSPEVKNDRIDIQIIKQAPKKCVATCLAMLTHQNPDIFDSVDKDDPYSWSVALKPYNLKLVYCNTQPITLKHYRDELEELNDLFLIGLYTSDKVNQITAPLNKKGTNGSSHLVLLKGQTVYDPNEAIYHLEYFDEYHVKRIFRVVPLDYERGL